MAFRSNIFLQHFVNSYFACFPFIFLKCRYVHMGELFTWLLRGSHGSLLTQSQDLSSHLRGGISTQDHNPQSICRLYDFSCLSKSIWMEGLKGPQVSFLFSGLQRCGEERSISEILALEIQQVLKKLAKDLSWRQRLRQIKRGLIICHEVVNEDEVCQCL